MWKNFGSHAVQEGNEIGVAFAVWAPNAQRVSVVGTFNNWDGRRHGMRLHPAIGAEKNVSVILQHASGEAVRVTGAKRDDLQKAIAELRKGDFGVPLQFDNFRD